MTYDALGRMTIGIKVSIKTPFYKVSIKTPFYKVCVPTIRGFRSAENTIIKRKKNPFCEYLFC